MEDKLDELTEELTAALVILAGGEDPEVGFVVAGSGPYLVGFTADATSFGTIVAFTEPIELDDLQLMIIGSLDLEPNENSAFVVEYEIEEDEEWEEQTLREFALRGLALLVHVFRCDLASITVDKVAAAPDD